MDEIDIDFGKAMEPGKEYWVMSGASTSYDLREEIKSWGGFWVPDHKCWAITNPCDKAKLVLKGAGLSLQFRRNV